MKPSKNLRYLILVLGAVLCLAFAYLYERTITQSDEPGCRNIIMYPSYARVTGFDESHTRLARKYTLYLYREQGLDPRPNHMNEGFTSLQGLPVLFIPGNAGSHRQIRSIASKASNLFFNSDLSFNEGMTNLDFFAAYFNEDFTAFNGRTLLDQAEYLNEAVKYILRLYAGNENPPTEVLMLGHSMGGFVARTMLTLPNYKPHSIKTIITLSTPHTNPPLNFDGEIVRVYSAVNDFWSKDPEQNPVIKQRLQDVNVLSISGGLLDNLVPGDFISLDRFTPKSVSVFSSGIEGVWTSIDHQAIVWCDQFRTLLAHVILEIFNNKFAKSFDPDHRIKTFKRHFLSYFSSKYRLTDAISKSIRISDLSEGVFYPVDETASHDFKILSDDEIEIYTCLDGSCQLSQYKAYLLPRSKSDSVSIAESSIGGTHSPFHYTIIPSTVKMNSIYIKPNNSVLAITQAEDNKISFTQSLFRLLVGTTVRIPRGYTLVSEVPTFSGLVSYKATFKGINVGAFQPFIGQCIGTNATDKPVEEAKFHINLEDQKSINLHFHDKGPFTNANSFFEGTGNLGVWTPQPFEMKVRIDLFRSLKFFLIRYRLAVIPFALFWNIMTFIVQLYRFGTTGKYPSFSQTSASLIGVPLVVLVVVFNLVCTTLLCCKVFRPLLFIIRLLDPVNWILTQPNKTLYLGIQNAMVISTILMIIAIFVNTILATLLEYVAEVVKYVPQVNKSGKLKFAINVFLLLLVVFYLPYQLVYIICVILQIVKLGKTTGVDHHFNFSIVMLMLWLIPIKVPRVIVFIHDSVVHKAISFRSYHNILSIMPILIFANLKLKLPAVKGSTGVALGVFLCYFAFYSVMFGTTHTFWLYHLFNFLIMELLLLAYESCDEELVSKVEAIKQTLGVASEASPVKEAGATIKSS